MEKPAQSDGHGFDHDDSKQSLQKTDKNEIRVFSKAKVQDEKRCLLVCDWERGKGGGGL